jgi:mRNA interferase MazF
MVVQLARWGNSLGLRIPDEGDLIWTDFDPRVGREQSSRRPAVVVSPVVFWQTTRLAIVCPITYAGGKIPPATLADLRAKLAALMGM